MHTTALPEQPTKAKPVTRGAHRLGSVKRIVEQEWAPGLLFFLCDVVCWVGIYGILGFVRRDALFSSSFEYAVIDLIQLIVIVQALFTIGGYNSRTETRGLSYTAEHILAMISALAISALILYVAATFDRSMKPSRSVVLASFALFTPLSIAYRRGLRGRVAAAEANRAFLVIGAGEPASSFYRAYCASPNQQRLEFVDVGQDHVGQNIAGPDSPIIEGDLHSKVREASNYNAIILAESVDRIPPELLDQFVRAQFQRTRIYTLESFYEEQWRHVPTFSIDPFWPLQTGFQLSRTSPYHYLKRIFDVIASLVGLLLLWPLLLAIALLIRVMSGSPVIFKQRRVGRDDHLFTMYKFRTMEESNGSTDEIYTRKNDPRVSGLGRWLRKMRFDELPQLWNVLKGELSLIGPRAEWVECADRYRKKIPFYHFRHLAKPGITGWAQVNYPYGESDEDAVEKLKYDLYYIRHYSLTLDAMIVLKTIHTILFGKGR